MRKPKFTLFVIIIVGLLSYEIYLRIYVNVLIEEPFGHSTTLQMTRKDARDLDRFFREILIAEPLAFTLVGAKPLSFTVYRKKSIFPGSIRRKRGWKVWQKYATYFENSRLCFWREDSPWVEGIACLILADKEHCNRCLEENFEDFQSILGLGVSDIFKHVGKVPFFECTLKKHEALIGILLGFGKRNAWLFFNNPSDCILPGVGDRRVLDAETSTYAKKYLTMQTLNMSNLQLPRFVGDPNSDESNELMVRYMDIREKIRTFYSKRDFLSATLSLYKYGAELLLSDETRKDNSSSLDEA